MFLEHALDQTSASVKQGGLGLYVVLEYARFAISEYAELLKIAGVSMVTKELLAIFR